MMTSLLFSLSFEMTTTYMCWSGRERLTLFPSGSPLTPSTSAYISLEDEGSSWDEYSASRIGLGVPGGPVHAKLLGSWYIESTMSGKQSMVSKQVRGWVQTSDIGYKLFCEIHQSQSHKQTHIIFPKLSFI